PPERPCGASTRRPSAGRPGRTDRRRDGRGVGSGRRALGPQRHRRGGPFLVRPDETGSVARSGTADRRVRLRARSAPTPADAGLLPGRAPERVRPRPFRARRGRSRDAGCNGGGRRSTVRHPDAGRHRLLRALTTFAALYVPGPLREAVSDEAWLRAMLDAERVLGPDEDIFDPAEDDIAALCEAGQADASPVVPLARALREREPEAHGPATSQDILDTAAMLVSSRARELILADLEGLCAACADLAETHRSTPMIARTLLQEARPTTFGLK